MVGMWSGNNWAGTAADVAYHSRKEELLQVMFDLNIEAILGVRDDALRMLTDILQEAAVHKGNIKDTRAGKLLNDLFSRSEPLISYSLPAVLNENGESIDKSMKQLFTITVPTSELVPLMKGGEYDRTRTKTVRR